MFLKQGKRKKKSQAKESLEVWPQNSGPVLSKNFREDPEDIGVKSVESITFKEKANNG